MGDEGVWRLSLGQPRLKILSLSSNFALTYSSIQSILRGLQYLEIVKFPFCLRKLLITIEQEVRRKLPRLEYLIIQSLTDTHEEGSELLKGVSLKRDLYEHFTEGL